MKAELKTYRQSPRKVRLVTDLVKGKKVNDALTLLRFTPKNASGILTKLIESAIANAKHNHELTRENLYIKKIEVNPGVVMKRIMPRARGSAAQVLKRTSHISIVLEKRSKTIDR